MKPRLTILTRLRSRSFRRATAIGAIVELVEVVDEEDEDEEEEEDEEYTSERRDVKEGETVERIELTPFRLQRTNWELLMEGEIVVFLLLPPVAIRVTEGLDSMLPDDRWKFELTIKLVAVIWTEVFLTLPLFRLMLGTLIIGQLFSLLFGSILILLAGLVFKGDPGEVEVDMVGDEVLRLDKLVAG